LKFEDGKEFVKRMDIFADNIEANLLHNSGNNSYSRGTNQFTHLTFPEFTSAVKLNLGLKKPAARSPSAHIHGAPSDSDLLSLPTEVDWVSTL
jgi:hypothetical protein